MMPKVIFRADGNSEIGLGHITRSLAIAEMLKNDFNCVFATRCPSLNIKRQILNTCNDLVKLPFDNNHFRDFLELLCGDEIVVLDNYFFDTQYQINIKNKGCKLVCIDDLHDKHFVADAVINHTPGIQPHHYSTESYTKLYLGLKYALLRTPFLNNLHEKSIEKKVLFICFGGIDAQNFILKCLKLVKNYNLEEINVVTNSINSNVDSINDFIKNNLLHNKIFLYLDLNANQMLRIMNECNIGICSASTISFECMSSGMLLFVKLTAENQKYNYDYLVKNKLAYPFKLISEKLFTVENIINSIKNQNNIFNGEQKSNVTNAFKLI